MLINSKKENGIPVFELSGRFDAYEVKAVDEHLMEAARVVPSQVIVDLSQVNFIDSNALATLVRILKQCRQNEGDLYLCNLSQPVRIIFELTRLDRAFRIFDSTGEAIKSFRMQNELALQA